MSKLVENLELIQKKELTSAEHAFSHGFVCHWDHDQVLKVCVLWFHKSGKISEWLKHSLNTDNRSSLVDIIEYLNLKPAWSLLFLLCPLLKAILKIGCLFSSLLCARNIKHKINTCTKWSFKVACLKIYFEPTKKAHSLVSVFKISHFWKAQWSWYEYWLKGFKQSM